MLTETIDSCEGRAQYYDGAGAIRDMLQNHVLQVLALITMEPPYMNDAKEIRERRLKFFLLERLDKIYCRTTMKARY